METPAPSRTAAPAVVAVMVTRNPGPWFDEALESLAAQDYSNLAVLVVDADSDVDPTERIADIMPGAFVRHLDENRGYGYAANHLREIVDGAAFYCLLHDDVAPSPTAIRTLVGEALRSNAGVVGPKLVQFEDSRRILQVGDLVDKTGERWSRVEPGELDQEQHDSVRDVFVVPGGCTLVRSDLFDALGGFDEGIDFLNDDLNLCWRAHVAGARVIVAPDAIVGHAEALADRFPSEDRRERLQRHRIRTLLTCYSRSHLARVLPQALVLSLLEIIYSLAVGRPGQATDIVRAWRWNIARRRDIGDQRRRLAEVRRVPDNEVRRFQSRGFARLSAFLQSGDARGGSRSERAQRAVRGVIEGLRSGELAVPAAAWLVTAFLVGLGSRYLVTQPIASVGSLAAFDSSPTDLLRAYLSGWRDVGLGAESPAPTAFGIFGLAGIPFLGAMGMLRKVVLLGSIVAGLVGAYRLARPVGSPRAQAAALVVYGAIPLGYDAIADANWGALAMYGAAPWLLAQLARAGAWAPFGTLGGEVGPSVRARGRIGRVAVLAVVVAVLAAVDPAIVVVFALMGVAVAAGSALCGSTAGVRPMATITVAAIAVAVVLHVPWSFEFVLPGASWEQIVGHRGPENRTLLELLRFDVGPVGSSVISIALPVAALLPLLIGKDWRFDWAVRGWSIAIVHIGVTWAAGEGWIGVALPAEELLLAPAAAGLALAASMGVTAFEIDLRAHGFGWRQVAAGIAGAIFLVGALPTAVDVGNGRWYLPSGGLETAFAPLEADDAGRILWIGDPDVVPTAGFRLDDDLVFATTQGLPSLLDQWPGAATGTTSLVADAVDLARDDRTSRLGRLLAPMAIEYIVLPGGLAPNPLGGPRRTISSELVDVFDAQLDLAEVSLNSAYVVYRNEAALPQRAALAADAGRGQAFDTSPTDLNGAVAVLEERSGATTFRGSVESGTTVLHAVADADGWSLDVDGGSVEPETIFGWADGYRVEAGGSAVLRYDTSPLRYLLLLVQAAFWLAALICARLGRRSSFA